MQQELLNLSNLITAAKKSILNRQAIKKAFGLHQRPLEYGAGDGNRTRDRLITNVKLAINNLLIQCLAMFAVAKNSLKQPRISHQRPSVATTI